jgi:hypothetical protein
MQRDVEWILRYRLFVIGLSVLVTAALVAQIKNLHVVIDSDRMLP